MTQHEHCPQLQELPPNIQQFWEEKQQECGEKIIIFSYAVFVGTLETSSSEKSGILYLMERNLWFEDFPKPPLFLFPQATTYKKTLIQIPRVSITEVELVKKSGIEHRLHGKTPRAGVIQKFISLFTPDPTYLRVVQGQEGGELITYDFREVNDPDAWIQALQMM